ncbi:hypothetical protein FOZ74_08800 [Comamonas flocculans]|uniref:PAS domain-containing protein n=1 Tax=Comamonas flocculans TaxID=2597701 RepID=A0A5B8RUD3_9BURK|nr:hypothetical protein FOZ74_08800 [Comamonas flocculans]
MADAGTRSLNLPAGELRWLALVWLLVGLLLAGVLWLVKGQVQEREGALLAQQARMLSSLLAQQMVTLDGMLAVLADAPEHTREEAATGSGWLLRQVQAQARLAGGIVAVLDGQGVVLAASDGALIGTRHDGEPFFEPLRRAPSAQTLYLGPPHRQGLMGDALVLSRAIVSPRAQLLGVVSAAFDLSLLKRSFAEVRMAPDAVAQLIYGEQAMLIPLGDDSAGAALDPTAQGLALMRHRALGVPASVQQVAVHGQSPELLAAVQSLGLPGVVTDRPLTLSVARSTRAIMDNWLALARALGLLYLFSTMAALGGLLWVRRRRRRRQAKRQHERQELHNLQARWNAVLHATHIGIWDWDQRTRRVYYSPAVQTMLGYGEHEFGTSWHAWASLLHPDDRGACWGACASSFASARKCSSRTCTACVARTAATSGWRCAGAWWSATTPAGRCASPGCRATSASAASWKPGWNA